MHTDAPAKVEPVVVGPTWKPDPNHPSGFAHPERSLGPAALIWAWKWLQLDDGDPWLCTDEQERFVTWWYAIDERGRFLYRDGVFQRLKGHGKDPLGAVLCAIELVGPCRYDPHSNALQEDRWGVMHPVGQPHPQAWVQTAATSLTQTQNTMALFAGLFSQACKDEYAVDVGKEIVYAHHGKQRLEAVTSSPHSLEGRRATFVLRNEALALDTVLPTPDGWTTVADVKAGSMLYGSIGPTMVTKVTPVYRDRECFRVTFADGASIVADAGHLWQTKINESAALPKVRTTDQMYVDGRSFAVPLPHAIDSPERTLLLDPYVLGLWLGDGDSDAAGITVGAADAEELLALIRERNVPLAHFTQTGPGRALRISLVGNSDGERHAKNGTSIRGILRALGVLGNKHVPTAYLRGSAGQRLELLRGLMDSDGCIAQGTRAIFVNQNRAVAQATAELARSLGYRVEWRETLDTRWSYPRVGYRVSFRADEDVNPFRLERKASAVRGHRRPWKSIKSIEPVASVPVKCIEVDAHDHLFAAGEAWTLTHNTHWWLENNEGHEMDRVIARNLAKSKDGAARALSITNAYEPGMDSVAERAREAWEKVESGQVVDTHMLYDSLEAPPDAKLNAEDAPAIIEAVRGDSKWLDIERIVEEIMDVRNAPSTSRRFWYNQITAAEDAWVSPQEWDTLARRDISVPEGEIITLGFDGSTSDDHTALMGTVVESGHIFTLGVWDPEQHDGEAPRELIDGTVRLALTTFDVVGFFSDLHPWESYVDAWADDFTEKNEDTLGLCVKATERHAIAWDMRARQKEFTLQGATRFHTDIEEEAFTHDGNAWVRLHVHNARRRPNAWGVSFGKESRESKRKIDALPAMILARMARRAYLGLPKSKQRRKRTGEAAFW